jgi:hypothetical protein
MADDTGHGLTSTWNTKARPTMTNASVVEGTTWKCSGRAVQLKCELTVICIYRQRQQFTVFNNAQQCYVFRSIRPSSGINIHDLKTSEIR